MTKAIIERNQAIAAKARAAGRGREVVEGLAAEYKLSVPHIYRILAGTGQATTGSPRKAEQFAEASPSRAKPGGATRGDLYREIARTGLKRFGSQVDDDYDRTFRQGLSRRVSLFREMGDDPVCAAVLNALKTVIRRIGWYAEPGDGAKTKDDKQAAEFLQSCLDDMSLSWSDVIDQALSMIQYGFAPAELVYKKRGGRAGKTPSKYDDGRIGWRKWTFLTPDSLSPGQEWDFDDYGGLRGLWQSPPPDYVQAYLSIEKTVLFRTTSERGNPEGRALFRAMYPPWYFKKNLEEIEAIAAERLGAGIPVFYAGEDVTKTSDSDSDIELLKTIGRNVRVDEQMTVVIPFAKMGGGAKEGQGVLFELMSPPGKGAVDFNQTITRYEQRIAMVGLAQFMMLGMAKVGTEALATVQSDFFTLSVEGFVGTMADTLNRYAVERLIALNHFPKLTTYPVLRHQPVAKVDIKALAEYINKLAGASLITPGPELEEYLRKIADLPKPEKPPADIPAPGADAGQGPVIPVIPDEAEGEAAPEVEETEQVDDETPDTGAAEEVEGTEQAGAGDGEIDDLSDLHQFDAWLEMVERETGADDDQTWVDEFAPNYRAKAGEAIAGNLGRGSGGKFVRHGGASIPAADAAPDQPGRVTATPTGAGVRTAPGAAPGPLSVGGRRGLTAISSGQPVTASQAAELVKAGLAVQAPGGIRLTAEGQKAFGALVAQGREAERRSAKGKGGKGKAAAKGKKPAAEKKGGGGKGGKPEKPDKATAEAENFKKVALEAADIDDEALAQAFLDFAGGKDLTEANANVLRGMGLVEADADGNLRLSAGGKSFVAAAKKGDVRGAKDAMSAIADKRAADADKAERDARREQERADKEAERGREDTSADVDADMLAGIAMTEIVMAEIVEAEQFQATHDGVMIAFYPDPETAKALAVDDGLPVSDLHMTLAYLGPSAAFDADELDRLATVVRSFAAVHPALNGEIAGPAEFSPRDGQYPVVALVDLPGLPAWRQNLIEALEAAGFPANQQHGYIPHITRRYVAEGAPGPADSLELGRHVKFSQVALVIGGKRKVFDLGAGLKTDEQMSDQALADLYADLRAALRELEA